MKKLSEFSQYVILRSVFFFRFVLRPNYNSCSCFLQFVNRIFFSERFLMKIFSKDKIVTLSTLSLLLWKKSSLTCMDN